MSVSSEIIVKRTPPRNLSDEDAHYFEKDFETRILQPSVRILEQIDVSAEGILFRDNRIIPESFSQKANYHQWRRRSVLKAHVQNILRKRSKMERAVWVTDDWSRGYFHWLSDVVPKMVIARGEIENHGLLLPAGFQDLDLVKETLSILDIKNVAYVPAGAKVRVEELYKPIQTPISGDYNESIIRDIRQRFRSAAVPNAKSSRIYVSRRRANKRRVVNEDDLLRILDEFKFAVVEAEELSFRQQIDLFSGCEYLVSIHGAGLVNMLFMPPTGRVLELRKRDTRVPNCFFNLASALRLPFYYQYCPAVSADESPHSANLTLDELEFRRHMERFLGV